MPRALDFSIKETLTYLKNPYYTTNQYTTSQKKAAYLLKSYLWCFLSVFLFTLFLTVLDKAISYLLGTPSVYKEFKDASTSTKHSFGAASLFVVVVAGPLLEELLFRLPLLLTKFSIALASALIFFRATGGSFIHFDLLSKIGISRIAFALLIFIFLNKLLPPNWLVFLKGNNYKFFFYTSAIIFGLIHLTNVNVPHQSVALVYPFFIIPQFIIGLFISNIRLHSGFIWGLLLHACINLTSFLLS